MRKKTFYKLILTAVLAILVSWLSANPGAVKEDVNRAEQTQPGLYNVEEVSDGDTIIVNMNGKREIVRFIGVDTPETHHPNRPVECYGNEASEYNRQLLTDKKVRLEADPKNTNRDRYDRLLRYVYVDGALVEEKLISQGYGFSYTQFPFSKTEQFNQLEDQAKATKKGLWGACQVTIEANGSEHTNPAGQ